jgi:hypothetical protein
MIKFKAWNASNSRAIAKFHNAEIGHFGRNTFIHELIRGSLGYPGLDPGPILNEARLFKHVSFLWIAAQGRNDGL